MKILVETGTTDLQKLIKLLLKSRDAYYNQGNFYKAQPQEFPRFIRPANAVQITDARYDKLEDTLRELDPTNKILRSVGAKPTKTGRIKVKLPYYMGSLTKVRSEQEIADWEQEYEGPYVISDKIDGISLLATYDSGDIKLYTRGEATVGQDITHLAASLKLPRIKATCALRGELVMSKGKFSSKWSKMFANPRNMAAGIANRKDVHEAVKDLTFMVYEVLEPRLRPSKALAWAKSKGFTVVPHKVIDSLDPSKLNEILLRRRSTAKYEIDGLVLVQDKVHSPNKKPTPDWARAYKSELADDSINAVVEAVEWNLSRHSYLIPRIRVKPVKLRGVTVKYASGKNAAFIRDNKIGAGAVVKLRRSGDVIPDIKDGDVIKPAAKAALPPAKYKWKWNDTETNIVLLDKKTRDPEIAVQIIEHFFKTLGVERIKAATLQLFVEQGYTSVIRILRMTRQQFTRIEGGTKTLNEVYDQLQEKLASVDLPTLMDASNIFGRGFGTRRCRAIVSAIPNIMRRVDDADLADDIDAIEGFDTKTANAFVERLPLFAKWLRLSKIQPKKISKPRATSSKLSGQSILFTGFRDTELEQLIQKNGGSVASGASKATILLAKDPNGSSSKLDAARRKGIKIMTAEQFRKRYDL